MLWGDHVKRLTEVPTDHIRSSSLLVASPMFYISLLIIAFDAHEFHIMTE